MYGRARLLFILVCTIMTASPAGAQLSMQPTPRPVVTAENEGWYLAGDPIMFSGNVYHPAGPEVYFDGNEMVRSGFYLGIPLYTRTTEEPYSRVFVPLSGGLMQPYERRRAGEIAGTSGSTAPNYPVAVTGLRGIEAGIPQAPGPPTLPPYANEPATAPRANLVTTPRVAGAIATSGPEATVAGESATGVRHGSLTALRPKGLNGVFIEYENRRWFSSGRAVPIDPARFARVGDYRGFTVYEERGASRDTIYVQLAGNVSSFAAPYSLRR